MLFGVHTNYVITLSRTSTGTGGRLGWVSKGMFRKRWSPGGAGIVRHCWLVAAGAAKVLQEQGAVGEVWWRWMLEEGEKEPKIHFFLRKESPPLFTRMIWM